MNRWHTVNELYNYPLTILCKCAMNEATLLITTFLMKVPLNLNTFNKVDCLIFLFIFDRLIRGCKGIYMEIESNLSHRFDNNTPLECRRNDKDIKGHCNLNILWTLDDNKNTLHFWNKLSCSNIANSSFKIPIINLSGYTLRGDILAIL